jgi:hypothetical protein
MFYGTVVGDRQVWPATDIAAWMHETTLRLFPDSPYAQDSARAPEPGRSVMRGKGWQLRADPHLRRAVDYGAQRCQDLRICDEEAIEAAGDRLKRAGDPPHSVSLDLWMGLKNSLLGHQFGPSIRPPEPRTSCDVC